MRKNLSEQMHNALSEIGNIGAGNATTALSLMLSSKLTMTPPEVSLYDFNQLENIFGGADATIVGVLSNIEGDINVMLLFVLGEEDAKHLIQILVNENISCVSDYGKDVINEIGNIMIGSYVASLESLSGIKMRYALPEVCIDMAGAILSVPCTVLGQVCDRALLINSGFQSGEKRINGYIMMISESNSYDIILEKLGIGESYE